MADETTTTTTTKEPVAEAPAVVKDSLLATATTETPEEVKEEVPAEAKEEPKAEEKPEEKKEPEAPYKLELKAPEGQELTPESVEAYTAVAKELNLSPEAAQKLADLHWSQMKDLSESFSSANAKAWEDTQKEWSAQIDKDPELGGDAKKSAMVTIGRALDTFGSKEAREAFDLTGAGNNPAIVKFIHNMAKQLSEGGMVVGEPTRSGPKTAGQALYGDN